LDGIPFGQLGGQFLGLAGEFVVTFLPVFESLVALDLEPGLLVEEGGLRLLPFRLGRQHLVQAVLEAADGIVVDIHLLPQFVHPLAAGAQFALGVAQALGVLAAVLLQHLHGTLGLLVGAGDLLGCFLHLGHQARQVAFLFGAGGQVARHFGDGVGRFAHFGQRTVDALALVLPMFFVFRLQVRPGLLDPADQFLALFGDGVFELVKPRRQAGEACQSFLDLLRQFREGILAGFQAGLPGFQCGDPVLVFAPFFIQPFQAFYDLFEFHCGSLQFGSPRVEDGLTGVLPVRDYTAACRLPAEMLEQAGQARQERGGPLREGSHQE